MGNSVQIKDGSFHLVSGSTNISSSTTGSEYIASVTIDPNDPTSFYISGSNLSASIYVSSSGKMGFGTTDPLVAFDVRADEFQIQKTSKRQGVRVNEEGNIESFNSETDAVATGSEFILTYARGGKSKMTSQFLQDTFGAAADEISGAGGASAYFDTLRSRDQEKLLFLLEKESGLIDISTVGDTLGSIRWVAASGSADTFDKSHSIVDKVYCEASFFSPLGTCMKDCLELLYFYRNVMLRSIARLFFGLQSNL